MIYMCLCFEDPLTKELFKGKDFKVSEVLKAFGALDEDGSGKLNLSEVVHGIGALLKVEQNEVRVRAFLKKGLKNEDGKGQVGPETAWERVFGGVWQLLGAFDSEIGGISGGSSEVKRVPSSPRSSCWPS